MKVFLLHIAEKLRASAWTIPTILSLSAIALAQFSLWADNSLANRSLPLLSWFSDSSPDGSRAFLSTIATSMLAVAGVSFSSIMVTVTLASQQFGPRLLRNFIKDKFSQTVLGVLIATFIYCIFIIRRTQTTGEETFIPQVSTLIALVLSLVCLAMFIRFVHHIITDIQAEEVVSDAYQVLEQTIDFVFPNEHQEHRVPDNDLSGWDINCGKSGYVQAVNLERLVEIAKKHDLILATDVTSGHFVSEGQAAIQVIQSPEKLPSKDSLIKAVQECFFVGPLRTPEQDFEYGIRQLVEIALRALSPGINDPFTAMSCIDYLGAGLQSAFSRSLPGSIHRDDDGSIRVYSWISSYRGLVEVAVNQIRQAAREKCDVSCRLLEMLTKTALVSKNMEQQAALKVQANLINLDTPPALYNDHDREAIHERFATFSKACSLHSAIDPPTESELNEMGTGATVQSVLP